MAIRDQLVADIATAEARIIEIENSPVYGQEYKTSEIANQKKYISDREDEIAGFDNMMEAIKKQHP